MTKITATLALTLIMILGITVAIAAAQTNAEIKNYSTENITIEYKEVSLTGDVSWNTLGDVSTRKSRVFRNITIGSVLRAKAGTKVLQEFSVNAPPTGADKVVLSVGK